MCWLCFETPLAEIMFMVFYSVTKNRAIFNQILRFPFRMFLVPSGGRFLPLHQTSHEQLIYSSCERCSTALWLLFCLMAQENTLLVRSKENNPVFVFSAASDCSGWFCTNNHVGDSNSCTNWNSSENSARDNGHLHCCHSKILINVTSLFVHSNTRVCMDVHMYTYM